MLSSSLNRGSMSLRRSPFTTGTLVGNELSDVTLLTEIHASDLSPGVMENLPKTEVSSTSKVGSPE